MARAKVIHSDDACLVEVRGNKARPEPSTSVIKFPGGHVEVSRTTNGEYWVHLAIDEASGVVDSRIDYNYEGAQVHGIPDLPDADKVTKIALRVNGVFRAEGE